MSSGSVGTPNSRCQEDRLCFAPWFVCRVSLRILSPTTLLNLQPVSHDNRSGPRNKRALLGLHQSVSALLSFAILRLTSATRMCVQETVLFPNLRGHHKAAARSLGTCTWPDKQISLQRSSQPVARTTVAKAPQPRCTKSYDCLSSSLSSEMNLFFPSLASPLDVLQFGSWEGGRSDSWECVYVRTW